MVDEFSSFARMPAPKFARVDAVELLHQAVFAQKVASPEIIVDMGEVPAQSSLACDARMVGQGLTNLLKNAAEAIASRHAEDPKAPQGRILASLFVDKKGAISLAVEDNGMGLSARDRDRLIEPYVTTREKGTGLGLAIVKRIMEEHGGELVLTDAPNDRGALITLKFPNASASGAADEPKAIALAREVS